MKESCKKAHDIKKGGGTARGAVSGIKDEMSSMRSYGK